MLVGTLASQHVNGLVVSFPRPFPDPLGETRPWVATHRLREPLCLDRMSPPPAAGSAPADVGRGLPASRGQAGQEDPEEDPELAGLRPGGRASHPGLASGSSARES